MARIYIFLLFILLVSPLPRFATADFFSTVGEIGQELRHLAETILNNIPSEGKVRCSLCRGAIWLISSHVNDGKPYCSGCYKQLFEIECAICGQVIDGRYYINYWQESYCERHRGDLPECVFCGRLVCDRLTDGGVQYEDGRIQCNNCQHRAITSMADLQLVWDEVVLTMWQLGLSLRDHHVPLELVSRDFMRINGDADRDLTGLTLSEIRTDETGKYLTSSIFILYGLRYEVCAAVMAHEWMHVWLHLNGFPEMNDVVKEGVCDLVAYLYLSRSSGEFNTYLAEKLVNNKDVTYGVGLRQALRSLEHMDFYELLQYVKKHQRFPL